jgi:hypothetical protein
MHNYFVNLIKKNKGSELFIIKFNIIPIFGIILNFLVFVVFFPIIYSKYFKFFIFYNESFEKIPLNVSNINSRSLNDKNLLEKYLEKLKCTEEKDSIYPKHKFNCSLKNNENIGVILTEFPADINLEFPKYYEISIQRKYKFIDFFENKYKESLALKIEFAEIFQLPKVKFLTGSNQIYILNYDQSNIEMYSIFYDFGRLYLLKYLSINKDFNESINLINKIESY